MPAMLRDRMGKGDGNPTRVESNDQKDAAARTHPDRLGGLAKPNVAETQSRYSRHQKDDLN